ncbi:chorismate--pyruvate lyase family protein [Piscinibacter sp.]|jgi:chorismate-pyruvate lyase|uniref:chorismate--pyruvate lyase family protein n=1 Tax=Piscinibacter sp. TaxID=1903157 RepID=UPI002F3FE1B1
MSSHSHEALRRQAFIDPAASAGDAAHARRTLTLLLAQDGSTTRLCEAVAGAPVELHVLHQAVTSELPAAVRALLPGRQFIERITCLAAHGEVMMDNLSYIALDGIEATLRHDLEAGTAPIGHLLARLWVRREPLPVAPPLSERLWGAVGTPDAEATRAYRIVTPDGPCMVIAETYRRGMLLDVHGRDCP